MASDHNMLEINPTPGARTEGDWTDNDPLMGWLQSTMHESQRRSRASRKEERLMYTLIQNDSSSAITHLRCLARDLAAGQSFTPSEQTDAIVSLDAIKRLLAQIPADLLPSPQLPWLNHVDTIMNSDRCVEPLTVPGTLSDLLSHAAAADIDSLECPLTPPTYMDAEDFKRPFTGPGADDLRAHIHDAQKRFSSASYAKVIPILQSSGSGKSRTVLQLGQKELGLMVCVRRSLNRGQVSEPPRDVAAAKWLQRKVSEKDFPIFDETRSLAVWLIALGEQINDLYRSSWESFKSNHVEGTWEAFVEHVGKLLSPVSAISSFASSLTEAMDVDEGTRSRVRDHLLGSIDSRAEELMDHTKFSLHEYKNYNPTAHTGRESGVAEEEAALAARFFQEALSQAFEGLSNFLKATGDAEAFFHLAIDECGELHDRLYKLRRLWQYLGVDCWMLWLDTNPEISLTYGTQARDDTSRIVSETERLLRPFTALPQDLGLEERAPHFAKILVGDASVTFRDLTEMLRGMGRPLLADSHVLHRGRVDEDVSESLSNLAEKITCSSTKPTEDSRAMIALTAQRFPMVMVGLSGNSDTKGSEQHLQNRNPRDFAESLVKSHMRRLVRISEDGKSAGTSGPSEPLLSLASAHTFCRSPAHYWSAAVKHISEAKAEYGLEIGEAGEEVVRLLLSAAMDFCWVANRTDSDLRLVRLDRLLTMLFGEHLTDEHSTALFEWAKGYWLNFTHMIQSANYFTTAAPLSRAGIVEAWARQGAILGPKNQTGWDLILPIYKSFTQPTKSTNFDVEYLSVIPVQTKNAAAGVIAGWNSDFSDPSVQIEKPPKSEQDFCTIWFDLRGKSKSVRVTGKNRTGRSGKNQSVYRHVLAKGHDESAIEFLSKFNPSTRNEIAKLLGAHPGEEDDEFLSPHTMERNKGLLPFFDHRMDLVQLARQP